MSALHFCSVCGREHRHGSDKYDAERTACVDQEACYARAFKTLPVKAYIGGFSPEKAYRSAPKLGDKTA